MFLLMTLSLAAEVPEDVLSKVDAAGVTEVSFTPRDGMEGAWEYAGLQEGVMCAGKISRKEHSYGERKGQVDILMTECVPTGGELTGKLKEATQGTKNLAARCDAGVAEACRQLGTRLVTGSNVEADVPLAIEVLSTACEGGDGQACTALGVVYRDQEKDEAKAGEAYMKGCLAGDGKACPEAGLMAPDLETAAKAFIAGCDAGDQKSCANLGIIYVNGKGVPRNPAKGKELLTTACEAEVGFACTALREL